MPSFFLNRQHEAVLLTNGCTNITTIENCLPNSLFAIVFSTDLSLFFKCQNDRAKAQKAMEATWNTMEKKEKIMWIKKAAEDQKRYEVSPDKSKQHFVIAKPHLVEYLIMRLQPTCVSLDQGFLCGRFHNLFEFFCFMQRELSEMRSPAPVFIMGKKMKFDGEPKKPPS